MRLSHKMPVGHEEWRLFMRSYLKAMMMLRGETYEDLAVKLSSKFGIKMGHTQLRHLVNRGTFRAEIFLQCASAMDIESIDVPQFEPLESKTNRRKPRGKRASIRTGRALGGRPK